MDERNQNEANDFLGNDERLIQFYETEMKESEKQTKVLEDILGNDQDLIDFFEANVQLDTYRNRFKDALGRTKELMKKLKVPFPLRSLHQDAMIKLNAMELYYELISGNGVRNPDESIEIILELKRMMMELEIETYPLSVNQFCTQFVDYLFIKFHRRPRTRIPSNHRMR